MIQIKTVLVRTSVCIVAVVITFMNIHFKWQSWKLAFEPKSVDHQFHLAIFPMFEKNRCSYRRIKWIILKEQKNTLKIQNILYF